MSQEVRHRGVMRLEPIVETAATAIDSAMATWIGEAQEEELLGHEIEIVGAQTYSAARVLVWNGDQPRGFIELPMVNGSLNSGDLAQEIARLPAVPARPNIDYQPPATVAVCTYDRPDQLRAVLASLARLDYRMFEILVVDNHPTSELTPPVVREFASLGVRLAEAGGQGLSIARNVALLNASHDIVAFTDDDVVVEPTWLRNLVFGFSRDSRVACVCGMVPSVELTSPAQSYFDRRVDWASTCEPALFDIANPPAGDPLFPLRVAKYGTGANFAVRKSAVVEMGGFDEGMGAGSPTGGGEDIDLFVRTVVSGRLLAREPSAVVWHRHRRTIGELERQIHDYGLGLGAWIAKLLSRPRTALMVLLRLIPGLRHLSGVTVVEPAVGRPEDPAIVRLSKVELRGMLAGVPALLKARREGRSGTPLRMAGSGLFAGFNFRAGQMWGAPGNSIAQGRKAVTAILLGVLGLIGVISVLPTPLRVVLVGLFVLGGPGSLAMSWHTDLSGSAQAALTPTVSLACCILTVTVLVMLGFYNAPVVLAGLTVATILGGMWRCRHLARRARTATA